MMASFCFMPWEYAEIGLRQVVGQLEQIGVFMDAPRGRSSALTPKISAMKFRYLMPVMNS